MRNQVAARGYEPTAVDAPTESRAYAKPRLVPRGDDEPDQRSARLARTIELEIVPRLVLARRATPDATALAPVGSLVPDAGDVTALADLVRGGGEPEAAAFVETLRARGLSVETLYLDLLAPAARHLGELWVADLCHFAEVTLGLCRLQRMLRELGPAFRSEVRAREHGRRALLVPVPGEQHTFGLFMVAEFFRRAGWDVRSGPLDTGAELGRAVAREAFSVVGLSVSGERQLEATAASIRAIRRASCNRAVGILVGGPIFIEHPELVAMVGADATAVDGRQAVHQAQNLLVLMAGRA